MSLRARIALLIVVSIVGVVAVAAMVSVQLLDRPDRESFYQTFAEEVRIVASVLQEDPDAAARLRIRVGPPPRDGDEYKVRQRRFLSNVRGADGEIIPTRIVHDKAGRARQLAFEFADGQWAYLPFLGPPPRDWPVFVANMALVTLGAIVIALLIAGKVASPLRLLEKAVATVGPDGLPAKLPEKGPMEVRETARALNRLIERVKTGVETRMRLVAAAGHDLRTPMTRMRLRAEFLPEEDRELWLKDLEELDRIADSAIRLVREEVDPQTLETVALPALLTEIARELRDIGRAVETTFDKDAKIAVAAPPLALKRALRNLVENAAVHGGGARIALARQNASAVVTITDDGPGIPPELIERAFEPFFRVDPGRRKLKPGAGLGMAIAKEIVDRLGGRIEIANRPKGGFEQVVRLSAL
ncbi:sensor histidine kinase [Fulvimarina pelagi HTCC2506]|uniref:histidine kinase n=2 Tax=Fulvimarina pelagi TaxID=217511 RepID=Q0FZB1_9HYPH|nr:ATP-binding protein [Fulvimarina pelagi]EAU40367.1 sensor histidine kinase [Fulvimarina pelagi HTCC2506]BAT31404.1 sensor histidine kinase [Fulvimarina pelagi]